MAVAIPLVFPDYLIMVETPTVDVQLPDFLTSRMGHIRVPSTKNRLPYLGHAGIRFVEGKTGTTKYYEYGRYDPAAHGLVRKRRIPDMKISSDGRPSAASLKIVLTTISRFSGQGRRINRRLHRASGRGIRCNAQICQWSTG